MKDWVAAAKTGDEAAWSVLYRQYYPAMYACALRLSGSSAAARDAVQDAFVTAYLKLEQLQDNAVFGGWIKRILVNICYRRQQGSRPISSLNALSGADDRWWDDEISRNIERSGSLYRLHTAMAGLPDVLRSTILLRYFSGFGAYDDIARVLSVPVGTVRSRISQAKVKLAEQWQRNIDASGDVVKKSAEWDHFYGFAFGNVHRSDEAKDKFMSHLCKDVEVIYTSGLAKSGSHLIEKEVQEDRYYGSWFEPTNIVSSGNISIVEAHNFNSAEYPDRCPPSVVFVLQREKGKASRINFYIG